MMRNSAAAPPLPQYQPHSHKGEVGKVLVIGGSPSYYGGPLLTALGAESGGADLIWLYLPEQHKLTAQNYSLNFFIRTFTKPYLSCDDIEGILAVAAKVDAIVLGNGLGQKEETQKAILTLLPQLHLPLILDAEALFPEILPIKPDHADWILTPHKKEFSRVFGAEFTKEKIQECANAWHLTILVKGRIDFIAAPQMLIENTTGCPQMRVGGTGDVLAGIVGSYRAQGLSSMQSCASAAYHYGLAGERLIEKENTLTAYKLVKEYAQLICRKRL